jgi:hypothetical protein
VTEVASAIHVKVPGVVYMALFIVLQTHPLVVGVTDIFPHPLPLFTLRSVNYPYISNKCLPNHQSESYLYLVKNVHNVVGFARVIDVISNSGLQRNNRMDFYWQIVNQKLIVPTKLILYKS